MLLRAMTGDARLFQDRSDLGFEINIGGKSKASGANERGERDKENFHKAVLTRWRQKWNQEF
jgi:hypothetical protein